MKIILIKYIASIWYWGYLFECLSRIFWSPIWTLFRIKVRFFHLMSWFIFPFYFSSNSLCNLCFFFKSWQDCDSESVFYDSGLEVGGSWNDFIVEIIISITDLHARLAVIHGSNCKEATWFLLQIIWEVFRCTQRETFFWEMFHTKILLASLDDFLSLNWMINNWRILIFNLNFSCASKSFRHWCRYSLDSLFHFI